MHVLISAPEDDWYVRIAANTLKLRWGPVLGYTVTVYEPGHKAFTTRRFENPHHANEWADSWGLPRWLTERI